MPLIVLKLGGSLLSCLDLAMRIRKLLVHFGSSRILMVVGGGESADVVRGWSNRFNLSEEFAHRIALRSLSVTRALLKALLPECGEVGTKQEASRFWDEQSSPVLLDIESSLMLAELAGVTPLPHNWDTTTDSIAAWVAHQWEASELILLKSTDLPPLTTLDQSRQADLVDAYFPQIADQIPQIRWCNLAAKSPQIVPWLQRGILHPG